MWAVRALAQFLAQLAVAVVIGLVVSALWALAHGGGFAHSLVVGFLAIGALTILLGSAGQATASLETAGRIPGMPAWTQSRRGDISVRPGALLIFAGFVLIGIGLALNALGW